MRANPAPDDRTSLPEGDLGGLPGALVPQEESGHLPSS
jgi:hypothetical protein